MHRGQGIVLNKPKKKAKGKNKINTKQLKKRPDSKDT